ncbi:MAG: hypothetical protein ACE5KK_07810 [Candidatus Brocadiales bacterium]
MKVKRTKIIEVRVGFTCRILKLLRGNGLVEKDEPLCRVKRIFPGWKEEDIESPASGYLRWIGGMETIIKKKLWFSPGDLIATITPPTQI